MTEQPQKKKQRSLLSWVSKTTTTVAAAATATRARAPLSASSAPAYSSSRNFVDGPPGLFSLDAESHVLYLPRLLKDEEQREAEERKEGKEEEGERKKNPTLFCRLREEVDWLQRDVTVFNRTSPQRRLVAYQSCREGRLRPYTYSGLTLEPCAATRTVMEVLERIELVAAEHCEITLPASASAAPPSSGEKSAPPRLFNSCLLNLYRGGSDCMGWHSDDEAIYYSSSGANGGGSGEIAIASASFGERRDFYLRPKPLAAAAKNKNKSGAAAAPEEAGNSKPKVRYSLGEGDVLLMLGKTQSRFQHSVPARATLKGERINLTFRWNVQVGGEAPRVVV